ncbi:MAG: succinate dehydrogenase [Myxococcota bacterium]
MYMRRAIVAASGLFICLFLVVHLSVNALLLLPDESARRLYNVCSHTLRESLLITVVAYLLYASIGLHVVYALLVAYRNRKTRHQRYLLNRTEENSSWTSQNMGLLGILVLLFLLVHLGDFWARIKLGLGTPVGRDIDGYVDVYSVSVSLFSNGYYVLFYSLLTVPLGLHLQHGLASGFKTLGFHHRPSLRRLATISSIYAGMMTVGFGLIPLLLYVR